MHEECQEMCKGWCGAVMEAAADFISMCFRRGRGGCVRPVSAPGRILGCRENLEKSPGHKR
jgi:hypothetical protein